jgi:hypothetical protein
MALDLPEETTLGWEIDLRIEQEHWDEDEGEGGWNRNLEKRSRMGRHRGSLGMRYYV